MDVSTTINAMTLHQRLLGIMQLIKWTQIAHNNELINKEAIQDRCTEPQYSEKRVKTTQQQLIYIQYILQSCIHVCDLQNE